ncbi:DUF3006 domain-containing protein [Pseudoneobacillus sp. C159]
MQNSYRSGKYTIDRFEGELAVLLYRLDETVELLVKREELPEGIEKGSILELEMAAGVIQSIRLLEEETNSIRKENEEILQKLVSRNLF